jgi:hypothetical protein
MPDCSAKLIVPLYEKVRYIGDMSDQDQDEQAREEVREKLRKSMDKLVGDADKPLEEQEKEQEKRGVDDAPPAPVTKSG